MARRTWNPELEVWTWTYTHVPLSDPLRSAFPPEALERAMRPRVGLPARQYRAPRLPRRCDPGPRAWRGDP
jgi:hypothetical protein